VEFLTTGIDKNPSNNRRQNTHKSSKLHPSTSWEASDQTAIKNSDRTIFNFSPLLYFSDV